MEELEDSGKRAKALESKPEIEEEMKEYVEAFAILSSQRSVGMGPNPISLTDILSYLQIYGATCIEEFMYHILSMDSTFLVKLSEKREREKPNGSSGSKQ